MIILMFSSETENKKIKKVLTLCYNTVAMLVKIIAIRYFSESFSPSIKCHMYCTLSSSCVERCLIVLLLDGLDCLEMVLSWNQFSMSYP